MNIRNKTRILSAEEGPFEARIRELLDQMTLEEKLSQITESWGIGGVERLGIPPLYKGECVHGYSYGTGCTAFPQAIAMAATFDTDMVAKIGEVTGAECKAANAMQAWSPLLDVARDPRWGRVEESFGEDSYLVEKIGLAWIDGYQSLGLTATPKHFAAHGAPLGGRDSHDVGFSERVLRETHYAPFRAAVRDSKVKSIMSAYHGIDGVPCTGSYEMLTKLLREEWGFNGYVVTDVGAPEQLYTKHTMTDGATGAAAIMAKAGVDLCATGQVYKDGLQPALEQGLIDMDDVDAMVGNILRVKFELGVFDREENPPMEWADVENWDAPEHREAALEAARRSIVMVKNDGVLPLDKAAVGKVALIGPAVKDQQLGDYSCTPEEGQLVTIYDAVTRRLGRDAVVYAKGCDFMEGDEAGIPEAVAAAMAADVAIVALGDCTRSSGENYDRADIGFTGAQEALLRAVIDTGKPVVLVAAVGKPTTMEYAAEHAGAILVSWFSGEEGGNAIADVLFGDVCPSGRLPMTFPRSVAQLPLYYNYHMSGRRYDYLDLTFRPRYTFGYGLSYTTFSYANLRTAEEGENVVVTAEVTNTGRVDAEEVAQLYLTDMVTCVSTPVTSLRGFIRVPLAAGETKTVRFVLTPFDLSLLDEQLHRRVEAGEFRVFVGGTSPVSEDTTEYRKAHLHYAGPEEGVEGSFTYTRDIAADFCLTAERTPDGVSVTIRNDGGIVDMASVDLYLDGALYANRRLELEPGEQQVIGFFSDAPFSAAAVQCRGQLLTL